MYVSDPPPTLPDPTPVVVDSDDDEPEDGKANNKPPTADNDKGHEDTAATANKTMAPKDKTKMPTDAAAKKPADSKTTSETDADYRSTTPAGRVVLKIYGISNYDKYAVSYFADGPTGFGKIEIYVNGMLLEVGGYIL